MLNGGGDDSGGDGGQDVQGGQTGWRVVAHYSCETKLLGEVVVGVVTISTTLNLDYCDLHSLCCEVIGQAEVDIPALLPGLPLPLPVVVHQGGVVVPEGELNISLYSE